MVGADNSRIKDFFNLTLFFIWPLSILFFNLKKFYTKSSRFALSLFGFFIGYTMINKGGTDGSRIGRRFIDNLDYSINDFSDNILSTYISEASNPDFYLSSLTFLLSRITSNLNLFFGILSFIYFFVAISLLRELYFLLIDYKFSRSINKFYIYIMFINILIAFPLSGGANAVRFPLATFYFFLTVLLYTRNGKNIFLLYIALSFLIHWSFLPVVILFYISLYISKFRNISYVLFIFTGLFLVNNFVSQGLVDLPFIEDSAIEKRVEIYTTESYVEDRAEHLENSNWNVKYYKLGPHYFCLFLLGYYSVFSKRFIVSRFTNYFFILSLSLGLFATIVGNEAGLANNRFIKLLMISTFIFFVFLLKDNSKSKGLSYIFLSYTPIFILQCYMILRTDIEVLSLSTYFGNLLTVGFSENTIPIIDLFK